MPEKPDELPLLMGRFNGIFAPVHQIIDQQENLNGKDDFHTLPPDPVAGFHQFGPAERHFLLAVDFPAKILKSRVFKPL